MMLLCSLSGSFYGNILTVFCQLAPDHIAIMIRLKGGPGVENSVEGYSIQLIRAIDFRLFGNLDMLAVLLGSTVKVTKDDFQII